MVETITIDSRTMVIKTDNEEDLSEIIVLITQNNKDKEIDSYLKFAARNRIEFTEEKFIREEFYDR